MQPHPIRTRLTNIYFDKKDTQFTLRFIKLYALPLFIFFQALNWLPRWLIHFIKTPKNFVISVKIWNILSIVFSIIMAFSLLDFTQSNDWILTLILVGRSILNTCLSFVKFKNKKVVKILSIFDFFVTAIFHIFYISILGMLYVEYNNKRISEIISVES